MNDYRVSVFKVKSIKAPIKTGMAVDENGNCAYYLNGELHRIDGPAVEYTNGVKEYWEYGVKLNRKSTSPVTLVYQKVTKPKPTKPNSIKVTSQVEPTPIKDSIKSKNNYLEKTRMTLVFFKRRIYR